MSPNPGKCKDGVVGHRETKRRFKFSVLAPLVKTVSGDEAAAFPDGFSECWLSGNRLRTSVYHLEPDAGLFRPKRDQAPPHP